MPAYRKIAVPLFGSSFDAPALDAAFALAAAHGAAVDAVLAQPSGASLALIAMPGFDISGYSAAYAYEAMAKAASEAAAAAEAAYHAAQAHAGDIKRGFRRVEGDVIETVERETRLCDLAVFCAPKAGAMGAASGDALLAALLAGTRPVMILPEDRPRIPDNPRVAIAFDGGAAAAHAVQAALPILATSSAVVGLSAGAREAAEARLGELSAYLSLHGVGLQPEPVADAPGGTTDALLRAVVGARADVLVLGGYGHSRVREFVLGGVTRRLLHHGAPLPLLMAR